MGSREGDLEVADVEHHVGRVLRRVGRCDGRCRCHGRGCGGQRIDAAHDADAEALGDGLPEEVERQAGHEHGDPRGQCGSRVDVDRADAVVQQATPVVARRLDAEAEEGESGEGQQRSPGADRGVDDQRLTDVRKHVAQHDPHPPHADRARDRHVVPGRHAGDEGLRQPPDGGRSRQSDGQHRALGADSEDHREEEREQESRERDREVDRRRRDTPGAAAEQERRGAEHEPDDHRDGRGEQRELDRQPGRDEDSVEDVSTQVVRAGPVFRGRAGEDVAGVDRVGLVGPQDRCEDGERQHDDHEHRRRDADRRAEHPEPASGRGGSHLSLPGSSSAGRARPGRRRRRCSPAARPRRTRGRWPARAGSPC